MKTQFAALGVFFLILLLCSSSKLARAVTSTVRGKGTLLTKCQSDTTFDFSIGNGVNLQPSYYNGGQINFGWALMRKNKKIKAVRIEIEPAVSIKIVQSWIAAAVKNGYGVIATYHQFKKLGSNNPEDLMDAARWWRANYRTLVLSGPFYINLINEWGNHSLSANTYAYAYNKAIAIVRQVYSGPIIIDCPGWGQETNVATAAVKGIEGTAIKDTNIVLSVHIYPHGWNQAENHIFQKSDLDELASTGRACIVGEFGNGTQEKTNWAGMVKYAKSLGWPVFGWCWNGDGGKMNMVKPAWKDNPNASSYTENNYFTVIYGLL
jgi:hypothetical protein